MFDAAETQTLQRARGRVAVAFTLKNGQQKLQTLHQSGCAKAILPKTYDGSDIAVLVNTSGGVTGGDRLQYELTAGAGTRFGVTTQAAERIYKSSGGDGQITTYISVGDKAHVDWLPQETILFEGSRLERRLNVELAASGTALLLESLILGRKAMGEDLQDFHLTDRWNITRDGRPIYIDALRFHGGFDKTRLATLGGATALATIVYVGRDADDRLAAARSYLPAHIECAASAWNGQLVMRFLSRDAAALRVALIEFLTRFRGAEMPRVWTM